MTTHCHWTTQQLAEQIKHLNTEIADETAQYTRLVLRFAKEAEKVLVLNNTSLQALSKLTTLLVQKMTNFHTLLMEKNGRLEKCLTSSLPELQQRLKEFQTWYVHYGHVALAKEFARALNRFLESIPPPTHGLEELAFAEFHILKECITTYPMDRAAHASIENRLASINYVLTRLMDNK